MDVAVSDEIRFSNVYRRNDSEESFSFEGYDFWLRGFSTMKICTGRKGGGGGGRILENLHAESLDEDRFDRVMENFYWASDTWSIVRLFFKFWRMLAFFFFSEKVDFSIRAIFYRKNEDPGNLVTESSDRVVQRSWRVHLVYLCGFDRLNDDTSSLVR